MPWSGHDGHRASPSLYLKVAVPLVVGVAGVTLGIIGLGAAYKDRMVHDLALERAQGLSALTRSSIARVMRTGHRAELQLVLEEVGRDRDITAVRILSPDGMVARSARVEEVGQRLPLVSTRTITREVAGELHPAGNQAPVVLHTLEPIPNGPACRSCHRSGDVIGLLDLDVSLAGPMRSADEWWNWSLMLAAGQALLVILLSATVLGLVVVRPIRRLRAAMEQVRGGDFSAHLAPMGNREMDELAGGFNMMVGHRREAAEAEANAHRRDMERAERLATFGQMAASLAHEIRNPLTGVGAALGLFVRSGQLTDPQRSMLMQSLAELNRVERVLQDLLDYARPRMPTRTAVDLSDLIEGTAPLLHAQAVEVGAELKLSVDGGLPPVSADPVMLRQVVVNLALNAMQAVTAASRRVVAISTARSDNHVVCRVRDSGTGVPAERADKIFSAFFTTKARGTGLGLAISQRLIELHGGRLWLENPGEPGASFAFALPIAVGSESATDRHSR
ncbi:MAG: HAMP domain-containing protein [Acidobacteria bacterium]|nr:HAMP domain-containing protein [Acidobacteriota bacterium]